MDYVQIRFESRKVDGSKNLSRHNTRVDKPNYLRNDLFHNQFKDIFYLENEEFVIENRKDELEINKKINKIFDDEIKKIKSETKNFREKKHSLTQEAVITLSNSINEKLEKGEIKKEELEELFSRSVKELEKTLGLKCLYYNIHYLEKVPHIHCSFRNYYDGKSISTKLKKQYSKSQDIVGNVFEEIGFHRGERGSKAKHLSIQQCHQIEKDEAKKILDTKKNNEKRVENFTKTILENSKKMVGYDKNKLEEWIKKGLKNINNYRIDYQEDYKKFKKITDKIIDNNNKLNKIIEDKNRKIERLNNDLIISKNKEEVIDYERNFSGMSRNYIIDRLDEKTLRVKELEQIIKNEMAVSRSKDLGGFRL